MRDVGYVKRVEASAERAHQAKAFPALVRAVGHLEYDNLVLESATGRGCDGRGSDRRRSGGLRGGLSGGGDVGWGAGLSHRLFRGGSGRLGGGGGLRAAFDQGGQDFGLGRRDSILFTRWQLACSPLAEGGHKTGSREGSP